MSGSLLHQTLRGKTVKRRPFWFMRQAGRYLPEYRAIREKTKDFLSLCYTPELASEITLQPIRRFDMDAAIIFSDILVIPDAMGRKVRFEAGEGPRLVPLTTRKEIEQLTTDVTDMLSPVAKNLKAVRSQLAPEKALIGFCGAPWTVACYMVEGKSSPDFAKAKKMAQDDREVFSLLMAKITESSIEYLRMQIKAGADIVQIFDSWAGLLSDDKQAYDTWVIEPTKKLVAAIKSSHPEIPIIGFPRGSGEMTENYAAQTGVDGVSIDTMTKPAWAKKHIQKPLQGNLDPQLLADDKNAAIAQTKEILEVWKDRAFIFNLGHGILQTTPIENVQAVCDTIRKYAA